jgi:hypothetical protein
MTTKKKYLIDTALSIVSETGLRVFPTTDKKPVWSNADLDLGPGEGSYKIATDEEYELRRLFERGSQVSVPMQPNGLVAIDVDLYKGKAVEQWHKKNKHWLEGTRTHKSGNGGLHYIFKADKDLKLPGQLAEGVDVKYHGYVVWPPQDGYTVIDDADFAPLPETEIVDIMLSKGGTGSLRASGSWNDATDEELIADIDMGVSYHPALRSLSVRLAARRIDEKHAIAALEAIMDDAKPLHDVERWEDRRSKIPDLIRSAYAKYGVQQGMSDSDEALFAGMRRVLPEPDTNFTPPSLEQIRAEVAVKEDKPKLGNLPHPPGLVGEIASYHDMKSRHVTPQYGIMAGLTAVSSLLGNRYVVDMPKHDTNTNLFIVCLGPTGSGKELPRTIVQEVLTAAGQQDIIKDVVSEPAFHGALNHAPCMTWMPDEFGKMLRGVTSQAGHHTAGVLKFAMQVYGIHHGGMVPSKVYSNAKDAKPAIVSPYVVAMATTTRSSFEQVMSEDFIADGFLNRLLMVEEPQSVMGKINGSGKARLSQAIKDKVEALADNGALERARLDGKSLPNPLPIRVTAGALKLLEQFDGEVSQKLATTNDPTSRELMPRLHENAIRVAGVLACGDSDPLDPVLTEDHAAWAITFVRRSLNSMIGFALDMGGSDFDKYRRMFLDYIKQHGDDGVRARDISRRFKLPARQRDEVIELLEHADFIHISEEVSGATKQKVTVYRAV